MGPLDSGFICGGDNELFRAAERAVGLLGAGGNSHSGWGHYERETAHGRRGGKEVSYPAFVGFADTDSRHGHRTAALRHALCAQN